MTWLGLLVRWEQAEAVGAVDGGGGNLLLNIGPMPSGEVRAEELANLKALKPWMETYGESIYGTRAGPYVSGQWGGACTKDDVVYLHVFQCADDQLSLPTLPREVLHCEALGGEAVSFTQEADALTITLGKSKGRSLRNVFNSKKRTLHRVIKLTLAPGADIALIPVEGHVAKKQHGTLVNPMGE
jgi:alpha-L-fucosidase